MTKATLEFDLPEDNDAHLRCVKALDLCSVIWDLDQWLRSKVRYGEDLSELERDILDKAREELSEIKNTHNINLDELYR